MTDGEPRKKPRRSNNLPSEAFPVIGRTDRCMHGKPMPHNCAEVEAAKEAARRGPQEAKGD